VNKDLRFVDERKTNLRYLRLPFPLIMAETNATILIPDISGFTEFMTSTELTHSSHAINYLIDAIVNAVGDEYELSEVEGDAVLLIRKGPAPSKKEVQDICLKIFNAFHYQRKWMQQHTICPCGACQAIINLTLKFVVHHGPVAEIKVGRFVKPSGPEMIVAHRLLKNSIANNEYLLLTEKFLQQIGDEPEAEMVWTRSSEEYPSIGKVDYRFALLNEARKKVPEPPQPQTDYRTDNTSYLEMQIASNYMDVYMTVTGIPTRPDWLPHLKKVEQEGTNVYIGSVHRCTFDSFHATLSPMRMTVSDEGIMYAEGMRIDEMDLSLVYEYVFKKTGDKTSIFSCRFMNANESPLSGEITAILFGNLRIMAEKLKAQCEKMPVQSTEV
jgi:hypothetical protein